MFFDATWVKTNMAPLRGWGARGERLIGTAPHAPRPLWALTVLAVVGAAIDWGLAFAAAKDIAPTIPDALQALIDATDSAGSAKATGDYARRLADMHARRRLINACFGERERPTAEIADEVLTLCAPAGGDRFGGEDVAALLAEPIPLREWLLRRYLCRGFVTVLSAGDGIGKTSLLIVWALAVATGRDLIGMRSHHRARVLLVTLEDDRAELQRRIAAACRHHQIEPAELSDWLYIKALHGQNVTLVTVTPAGDTAETRMTADLIDTMKRHRIDVLIADPFVKLSGAPENDNGATDSVCRPLAWIAKKTGAAVVIAHHHCDGPTTPGDTDNARGAKSLIDSARVGLTLTRISTEKEKTFEVPERDRWQMVQVIEAWTPPDAFQDMSTHIARGIISAIDAAEGLPEGERYTERKARNGPLTDRGKLPGDIAS